MITHEGVGRHVQVTGSFWHQGKKHLAETWGPWSKASQLPRAMSPARKASNYRFQLLWDHAERDVGQCQVERSGCWLLPISRL